jgi:hypothetical protein
MFYLINLNSEKNRKIQISKIQHLTPHLPSLRFEFGIGRLAMKCKTLNAKLQTRNALHLPFISLESPTCMKNPLAAV